MGLMILCLCACNILLWSDHVMIHVHVLHSSINEF